MKIYDRMYKELKFPPLIMELLDCPGLLRLRDVRMANNQFVAFPAFATTTRYEHSLGVCHLAEICAKTIGLDEKETLELMIACLYHDVGTPPFAHAMEEVLQARFAFDHEINLMNLIMGTTGEFDGELAQIYHGEGLKIRSVCQCNKARKLGIDIYRIAKLAIGDKDEYLSPLLNGNGMDLDNIDNIFRASSAMGLISSDCGELAENLACAFMVEDRQIYYNGLFMTNIHEWQKIRDIQYSAIYDSVDDFAYQTMIKKAISFLLEEDSSTQLDSKSWRLTDSSLTDKLLKHPKSHDIMKRVLLCRPYGCLGVLYVEGEDVSQYINKHLSEIEREASDYFIYALSMDSEKFTSSILPPIVVNFFPDKRKRQIARKAIIWNEKIEVNKTVQISQGALLGLFTPFGNSSYKTNEQKERISIRFGKNDLNGIIETLAKGILCGYKVSMYGGKNDGKINSDIESNQLGFF